VVIFLLAESVQAMASMFVLEPALYVAWTQFQASELFVAFSPSAIPGRSISRQSLVALLALLLLEQGHLRFLCFASPNIDMHVPPVACRYLISCDPLTFGLDMQRKRCLRHRD
jgi:hypothetical protein